MNLREIGELRRRFKPEKNAIGHIYGCYVGLRKEIISDLNESLALMPLEEAEKYLSLLKKALSGTLGKNLIDIVFSTKQVADSDEHRLLMSLRASELKDSGIRQAFYQKVIDSLDLEGESYLILPTTPTTFLSGVRTVRTRPTPPTRCFRTSSAQFAR